MTSKQVTVTKYIACDDKEFNDIHECLAYEQEKAVELEVEIRRYRGLITSLKEKANESRLKFRLAQCEANEALKDGKIITFHKMMAEYYEGKIHYLYITSDLCIERRYLNKLINKYYLWFGRLKHKSTEAKAERRKKSLRWRQENTPDKWRTPNKIRVNKLPKEEQ